MNPAWSLVGMDWAVPDFGTLSCRQQTLAVNIPDRGFDGLLRLLIDSTGIKVEGEGAWNARKHGGPKRRAQTAGQAKDPPRDQ